MCAKADGKTGREEEKLGWLGKLDSTKGKSEGEETERERGQKAERREGSRCGVSPSDPPSAMALFILSSFVRWRYVPIRVRRRVKEDKTKRERERERGREKKRTAKFSRSSG